MPGGDTRGVALLEAMVALVLAGAVIAAGFAVAAADLGASRRAAELQLASALAEDLLSRAALAPADQVDEWSRGVESEFDAPLDHFSWRMAATPVAGEPGLRDLRMEVRWKRGRYRVHSRIAVEPATRAPDAVPDE